MFKSGYIAILGAPNAGKSTLLNHILQEKISSVTHKPQTTRKHVLGIHSIKEGQLIFLDTPGVHSAQAYLNKYMFQEIKNVSEDADILLYLVPVDKFLDTELISLFRENQKLYPKKKCFFVLNKVDLNEDQWKVSAEELLHVFQTPTVFEISSKQGIGVEPLIEEIVSVLPEGPSYFPEDQITNQSYREIVGEIILEKVYELMHQEIPYSSAVEIDSYKEEEIIKITASIVVESDSQKGMMIGKKGSMIKKIGTASRTAIEQLVRSKVFLQLHVRVDKKWTKNPTKMAQYGYKMGRH